MPRSVTRRVLRSQDWLVGTLLVIATAGFVLWQGLHVAVLWDLSYLLDTSWRIALGQVPYRDFPLVHPPGTFLVQAALMRLAGRHYLLVAGYAAVAGGLGTVVVWRILVRMLRPIRWGWVAALLLSLPLSVLGIYGVYPHPIYDCDCALAVLVALWCLQRLDDSVTGSRAWLWPGIAAVSVVAPVFFKQNIGLPFLLAVVGCACLLLGLHVVGFASAGAVPGAMLLRLLAGIAVVLGLAAGLLQGTVGLGNYLLWTVTFAAQRRLPGLGPILDIYRDLALGWMLPVLLAGVTLLGSRLAQRRWVRFAGLACLVAPFAATVVLFFLAADVDDRADRLLALWPPVLVAAALVALFELRKGITLPRLLPFCVLAAVHGTFLSQQLWGSTYAIWPLLVILIAGLVAALSADTGWAGVVFTGVAGAVLLVCGAVYSLSHDRLNYIYLPDGLAERATLPALRGMAVPGPYLADFEELVRFAGQAIPEQDGVLLLPGEEPFYFATGRVPQFPVQIFDRTTDPYTPEELMAAARRRGIRWVIVKTRLQSNEDPLPERARTMELIEKEFRLHAHLAGYDVYRRGTL